MAVCDLLVVRAAVSVTVEFSFQCERGQTVHRIVSAVLLVHEVSHSSTEVTSSYTVKVVT